MHYAIFSTTFQAQPNLFWHETNSGLICQLYILGIICGWVVEMADDGRSCCSICSLVASCCSAPNISRALLLASYKKGDYIKNILKGEIFI